MSLLKTFKNYIVFTKTISGLSTRSDTKAKGGGKHIFIGFLDQNVRLCAIYRLLYQDTKKLLKLFKLCNERKVAMATKIPQDQLKWVIQD